MYRLTIYVSRQTDTLAEKETETESRGDTGRFLAQPIVELFRFIKRELQRVARRGCTLGMSIPILVSH